MLLPLVLLDAGIAPSLLPFLFLQEMTVPCLLPFLFLQEVNAPSRYILAWSTEATYVQQPWQPAGEACRVLGGLTRARPAWTGVLCVSEILRVHQQGTSGSSCECRRDRKLVRGSWPTRSQSSNPRPATRPAIPLPRFYFCKIHSAYGQAER